MYSNHEALLPGCSISPPRLEPSQPKIASDSSNATYASTAATAATPSEPPSTRHVPTGTRGTTSATATPTQNIIAPGWYMKRAAKRMTVASASLVASCLPLVSAQGIRRDHTANESEERSVRDYRQNCPRRIHLIRRKSQQEDHGEHSRAPAETGPDQSPVKCEAEQHDSGYGEEPDKPKIGNARSEMEQSLDDQTSEQPSPFRPLPYAGVTRHRRRATMRGGRSRPSTRMCSRQPAGIKMQ